MAIFGDARLTRPLWPHQERALATLDLAREATYLVVPPGGGKTLIGLEATASRELPTALTVLTYQAVCTASAIHRDGAWLLSRLRESGPAVLAGNKRSAPLFARSWSARVSPGELLYSGSPEGTGVLAASRGDDPFAVTTQIRTLWR